VVDTNEFTPPPIKLGTNVDNSTIEPSHNQKELEKMGNSLWLTDMFVNHPFLVIVVGFGGIMIFCLLCFLLGSWVPAPITNRDLLDYADIRTKMFDMRQAIEGDL